MEIYKGILMKKNQLLKSLSIILFIFIACSKIDDSENPNLINDSKAKNLITLAALAKCASSGGTLSNIVNVESFVSILFSNSSTIASPDRKSLYYKKSNVNNCVIEILNYTPTSVCDFNVFAAADYMLNKKLCNLKPDRSIKLNIVSNK